MATKIILNRKSEWINRGRSIKFFIDNAELSKVKNGSSEEYIVTPGTHTLQCKIDWCGSQELILDLQEGETKFLKVRSGMRYNAVGYVLVLIALFSGVFLDLAHKARPEFFLWFQVALLLPSGLYLLYYLTLGKKNYLLLEEDKENIFR